MSVELNQNPYQQETLSQANAIVERVHQVISNIIRTIKLENNYINEEDPWKGILSATAFAVCSTFHTTLRNTPGQFVFGRDMLLNIKHEANWEYIRKRNQQLNEKKMPKGPRSNIQNWRSSPYKERNVKQV